MGTAKYIGRVGALAVSLGVGAAVVTWPMTALAEASDAGAAPSSETSSSEPSSSDNSTSADTDHPSSEKPSANPDPSEDPSPEDPSSEDPSPEDPSPEDPSPEDPSPQNDNDDEVESAPDPLPLPDPEAADPVIEDPAERGRDSENVARAKPEPHEVSPVVAGAASLDSPTTTRLDKVRLAGQTPTPQTATAQIRSTTTASSTVKPNVVAAQSNLAAPAASVAPVSAVSSIVSAFLGLAGLGPSLNATPDAPVEPPFLWAVLAWVRRQFQRTFFNQTPTAAPVQTTLPTAGVITGRLDAFDADGDPLQFTVTRAPTNGTVAVNPDGSYTYTPGAGPVEDDSFEVKVSDVGLHLHLSNLFAPDFGRSYVVTVPVNVAEAVVGTRIPVSDQPSTIEVRSDGTRAYVLHGPISRVSVIDTATDTVVATIPIGDAGSASRGLALRPDGTQAYVSWVRADGVGFLAVVNTADNTVTKSILVGNNTLNGVAVDANGVVYVAAFGTNASSPGVVAAVDVVTDMVTPLAAVGRAPLFVAVKPGGSQLYVTNFDDDTVSVVSGTIVVATIPVGDGADGIAFSSNGTRAYVTNFNAGTVSVIDAGTNTVITTVTVGSNPIGVTISPDGTAAYVATFGGNVAVIDTASNTVIANIPVSGGPADVAFRPDGQRAYVTRNVDDSVSVITFA